MRLRERLGRRLGGRLVRSAGLDPVRVGTRLDRQAARLAEIENDLARIGPQVAGLEVRLEDLRESLAAPGSTDISAPDLAEARSIVEELRREHERIRARLTAAARFEERLRQLEERLPPDQPGGRSPT